MNFGCEEILLVVICVDFKQISGEITCEMSKQSSKIHDPNLINQSYDSQLSHEDTTPVIRPWNQIKPNYEDKNDIYDDAGDEFGGDDQFFVLDQKYHDMKPSNENEEEEEDEEEEEQNAEDEDDNDKCSNDGDNPYLTQPLTPSRLLTISSIDFHDDDPQQYSNKPKINTRKIFQDALNETNLPNTSQSTSILASVQVPPPSPPTYPSDITGEVDLDAEMKYHDDLITHTMNQLNLNAQTHFQLIIEKLIKKYENILQSKDDFIHHQVLHHQQSLNDLQILLSNYENKLEIQSYLYQKKQSLMMNYYTKRYYSYISPYSVKNIFFQWKLWIEINRSIPRLDHIAKKFYQKYLLNRTFRQLYQYSIQSKYIRKMTLLTHHSNNQMNEMIRKYETEIATLQLEVQTNYQLLQQEKLNKLNLEENLRRLFLKNMTVMNMNALSLFQENDQLPEMLWTTATGAVECAGGGSSSSRDGRGGQDSTGGKRDSVEDMKRIQLLKEKEELEHEKYLQEQRNLRNEMRRQQEELKQRQQTHTIRTITSGGESSERILQSPVENQPKERSTKVISSNSKPAPSQKPLAKVLKQSDPSSSKKKPATPPQSTNIFSISGPVYQSKGSHLNNESSSSHNTSISRTTTITQRTSTMASSSTTMTSRIDQKLLTPSSSDQIRPSPLHQQPISRTIHPKYDSDDDIPQPRGSGPEALPIK